ncbi:hypothetical protein LINPERHAP2_LOCUS24060 [Linum perenne]
MCCLTTTFYPKSPISALREALRETQHPLCI